MPYTQISELPSSVRDSLPRHAQEIYMKAYNGAWEQYRDPDRRRGDTSHEETAHRAARSAVERE